MCIQASLARCGGRASSWGCCAGPGAFSGGRSGPKQSTLRPPLLKGGKNLVSGRGESSNSGHICSDPREGKKAWETESRDLKSLERRWGRENWTTSCQMTPRLGECQNWISPQIRGAIIRMLILNPCPQGDGSVLLQLALSVFSPKTFFSWSCFIRVSLPFTPCFKQPAEPHAGD